MCFFQQPIQAKIIFKQQKIFGMQKITIDQQIIGQQKNYFGQQICDLVSKLVI